MKSKWIFALGVLFLILCYVFVLSVYSSEPELELSITAVNDITLSVGQDWDNIAAHRVLLPGDEYDIDYAILDDKGDLVAATRRGITESISEAVRHRDTVVEIVNGNKKPGTIIYYNDTAEKLTEARERFVTGAVCLIIILVAFSTIYTVYLYHTFFRPFKKLKRFAVNVAAGNLDIPISMDRDNLFGPFTESFDLMREELAKAKERERAANISKKELAASLSHDIKTPLASIKAVSELMSVHMEHEEDRKQLEMIGMKIDQINLLMTNLLNAAVEELSELTVHLSEEPSTELAQMLKNADYQGKAVIKEIPQCIILTDRIRLLQVFDNIINNSYKYAGTDILINSFYEEEYLVISIMDYGKGVEEDDFPLIFRKFYRGRNAEGKSGSGLGLYISKYLIEKMGGKIICENREDGFTVRIYLNLA